jgi:hypothetical protein
MKSTILGHSGALALAAALTAALAAAIPSQAAEIKIGAPLALTGPLADEAKKQDVVWKMWLDKVNAAGGNNVGGTKMKVQLVKYDYQSDGQRAAQLAEKLITDDKVDFLLSPFGSGHTKIIATIAARYETPIVACAASSESVYARRRAHDDPRDAGVHHRRRRDQGGSPDRHHPAVRLVRRVVTAHELHPARTPHPTERHRVDPPRRTYGRPDAT